VEAEYHSCPESEFKKKLDVFRNQLIEESTSMNQNLIDIDNEIVFFGNYENQLAPDATINEIKRSWIELRDLGIFPGSECIKRGKRDEDRYTFFVTIELFFRDVNKARSFISAKKDKAIQKAEYLKKIEGEKKKEEPSPYPAKRKLSTDMEGFVKPIKKVVRTTSHQVTPIEKKPSPLKRDIKEGENLRSQRNSKTSDGKLNVPLQDGEKLVTPRTRISSRKKITDGKEKIPFDLDSKKDFPQTKQNKVRIK